MSLAQGILLVSGFVVEISGITLTSIGLLHTWQDHAEGQPFRPALWAELKAVGRRLVGKRPPIVKRIGTAHDTVTMSAFGHGHAPLPAEASVDQKLEQLKREVDAAHATAAKAAQEVSQLKQQLEARVARLEEQLAALRDDVTVKLRDQTLRGLPLAVFGLVLIGLGAFIQVISAFL